MSKFENYGKKLDSDTNLFLDEHFDTLLEEIREGRATRNAVHSWLDDDGKLHEFVDQYLDLRDAVEILEQCKHEETDSGLWEGLSLREAVSAMAFWSYNSDLRYEIEETVKDKLEDELMEAESSLDTLHMELDQLNEELESSESEDDSIGIIETDISLKEEEISDLEGFISTLNSVIDGI